MLILTREIGEQLVIGDGQVTVTVMEITGNQIRLGIVAPRDVAVNRQEIHDRMKASGEPAKPARRVR